LDKKRLANFYFCNKAKSEAFNIFQYLIE